MAVSHPDESSQKTASAEAATKGRPRRHSAKTTKKSINKVNKINLDAVT
jgi:hypothetical protein